METRTYHEGHRELQDQFDSRRLADRIEEVLVKDALTPEDVAFVHDRDMFFLATTDREGQPQCSYKGGDPGFVRVLEPQTLAFPSYDGNGMFLSLGNLRQVPKVGLLFVDFQDGRRLRVNGEAQARHDDPLLSTMPGARLVVRVHVTAVFPNCSRYVHRMQLVTRSPYVPDAGGASPVPAWKRATWCRGALPDGELAGDP